MEERMKILEMLSSGIINAQEANELLGTIDNKKVEVETSRGLKTIKMGDYVKQESGKNLRVRIVSADGDKVNVNIPIGVLKAAKSSGTVNMLFDKSMKGNNKNSFINDSIDIDLIIECIENGIIGNIVDIESADGDIVQIYID